MRKGVIFFTECQFEILLQESFCKILSMRYTIFFRFKLTIMTIYLFLVRLTARKKRNKISRRTRFAYYNVKPGSDFNCFYFTENKNYDFPLTFRILVSVYFLFLMRRFVKKHIHNESSTVKKFIIFIMHSQKREQNSK